MFIIRDSFPDLLLGEAIADKIIVAPNTLELRLDMRDIPQPVCAGADVVVGK